MSEAMYWLPLPHQVRRVKVFTKYGLLNAYNLENITRISIWPYGLANTATAIQAFMNEILRKFLNQVVVVCVYNILILPPEYPPVKIYIPQNMWEQVTQMIHTCLSLEHPGIQCTFKHVENMIWWPSMAKDITRFVRACNDCIHNR